MADAVQSEIAEIWKLFKETDARLDERIKETDARIEQRSRETDEKLRRLEGLMGIHWGRMLEALVEPGVLKMFQERGIAVHHTFRRAVAQQNGDSMEIDLLLENTNEAVAVEVKSHFTVEWVNEFLDDLTNFVHFFPKYQGYRLYGAIAGLNVPLDVARYAYRRGLFVIKVTGDDLVEIVNDTRFRPRDFGQN